MSNDSPECEPGVTVSKMLALQLQIPEYQRPYTWKEKDVSLLFSDVKEAMKDSKAYRIGTIILHRKNKDSEKYNIVDGQQRIITLHLLLKALGQSAGELTVFDDSAGITGNNLHKNWKRLERLVKDEFNKNEKTKNKYISYLKYKCEFVKITTESEDLAFQFFDSQNNRGKKLELYDILKAYHLRKIGKSDATKKGVNDAVKKWEESEFELQRLFNDYLYQIKQWSKSKNGNRSKWKMDDEDKFFELFKGFENDSKDQYRYVKYHLHTEREISQIDMPVVSGIQFFYDVFEYLEILKKIDKICFESERMKKNLKCYLHLKKSEELKRLVFKNIGNKYIYDMMGCALLFIATRFSMDVIKDDNVLYKIFIWAWSLRLYKHSISKRTINNYSLGLEEDNNFNVNLFDIISNSATTKQISGIELNEIREEDVVDKEKYEDLLKAIKQRF